MRISWRLVKAKAAIRNVTSTSTKWWTYPVRRCFRQTKRISHHLNFNASNSILRAILRSCVCFAVRQPNRCRARPRHRLETEVLSLLLYCEVHLNISRRLKCVDRDVIMWCVMWVLAVINSGVTVTSGGLFLGERERLLHTQHTTVLEKSSHG